ncbi:ABC transporter ATP-binding protein [Methylobacterium oxalidis]|uniref:ABC transporter ATP-binding protein n=1 Tax=Methylobacterium oxalidis TaxID=944322 RepID=UPI00331550CC
MPVPSPLLEADRLDVFYGDFQALFEVDLALREGEVVSVVGANGAGKSSLCLAFAGLARSGRPDAIRFEGKPIGGRPAFEIARRGIALVPEGRRLFPSLNVEENLLIGGQGRGDRRGWSLDAVYALFPILRERRFQDSTSLSGGQQQMVAIGRALMSNPRVLLCDEISLGLSPAAVRELYVALREIHRRGTAVLLVEQDITAALDAADRVYCLRQGRVTLEGRPGDLSRSAIHVAYFGS